MDDGLWLLIEPLLPPWPERSPGPRPVPDRLCLQGILYVLCNDIAWQLLPLELGFGSGQTCWRWLERWQKAGVFDQLHRILLAELNAADRLDWSRACVDGSHIRAKKGEPTPARLPPVDRRKTGSKHLLMLLSSRRCDRESILVAPSVTDQGPEDVH
ncbi:transposase, partial [Streptomyces vinaceus]|uniref:transposase n=1 Tax=Streptomyces vinaceus TaxID=1960 RepID=UPI0038261577